mgnify:CR=1 FL=1
MLEGLWKTEEDERGQERARQRGLVGWLLVYLCAGRIFATLRFEGGQHATALLVSVC